MALGTGYNDWGRVSGMVSHLLRKQTRHNVVCRFKSCPFRTYVRI